MKDFALKRGSVVVIRRILKMRSIFLIDCPQYNSPRQEFFMFISETLYMRRHVGIKLFTKIIWNNVIVSNHNQHILTYFIQ
jgi:hypothetical protein